MKTSQENGTHPIKFELSRYVQCMLCPGVAQLSRMSRPFLTILYLSFVVFRPYSVKCAAVASLDPLWWRCRDRRWCGGQPLNVWHQQTPIFPVEMIFGPYRYVSAVLNDLTMYLV